MWVSSYVALINGEWVALPEGSATALGSSLRDRFTGGSPRSTPGVCAIGSLTLSTVLIFPFSPTKCSYEEVTGNFFPCSLLFYEGKVSPEWEQGEMNCRKKHPQRFFIDIP